MKKTLRTSLAVMAILVLTATTAMATPYTKAGTVNDTSELRFTDMQVGRNGSVSFTLHNTSAQDATFNGTLLFSDSGEGVRAQSGMMSAISVPAGGSARVTTNLETGSYEDFRISDSIVWSGVRVEGDGRNAPPEVHWTVLN